MILRLVPNAVASCGSAGVVGKHSVTGGKFSEISQRFGRKVKVMARSITAHFWQNDFYVTNPLALTSYKGLDLPITAIRFEQ